MLRWCNFFVSEKNILLWDNDQHSGTLSLLWTSPLPGANVYGSTNFNLLWCTLGEVLASNLLFTAQFCNSDKECLGLHIKYFYLSSFQCWRSFLTPWYSRATWHIHLSIHQKWDDLKSFLAFRPCSLSVELVLCDGCETYSSSSCGKWWRLVSFLMRAWRFAVQELKAKCELFYVWITSQRTTALPDVAVHWSDNGK